MAIDFPLHLFEIPLLRCLRLMLGLVAWMPLWASAGYVECEGSGNCFSLRLTPPTTLIQESPAALVERPGARVDHPAALVDTSLPLVTTPATSGFYTYPHSLAQEQSADSLPLLALLVILLIVLLVRAKRYNGK